MYQQELLKEFHKELQEWKDEQVRQEVEFTITDRKVEVRRTEWALNTQIFLIGLTRGDRGGDPRGS